MKRHFFLFIVWHRSEQRKHGWLVNDKNEQPFKFCCSDNWENHKKVVNDADAKWTTNNVCEQKARTTMELWGPCLYHDRWRW